MMDQKKSKITKSAMLIPNRVPVDLNRFERRKIRPVNAATSTTNPAIIADTYLCERNDPPTLSSMRSTTPTEAATASTNAIIVERYRDTPKLSLVTGLASTDSRTPVRRSFPYDE